MLSGTVSETATGLMSIMTCISELMQRAVILCLMSLKENLLRLLKKRAFSVRWQLLSKLPMVTAKFLLLHQRAKPCGWTRNSSILSPMIHSVRHHCPHTSLVQQSRFQRNFLMTAYLICRHILPVNLQEESVQRKKRHSLLVTARASLPVYSMPQAVQRTE